MHPKDASSFSTAWKRYTSRMTPGHYLILGGMGISLFSYFFLPLITLNLSTLLPFLEGPWGRAIANKLPRFTFTYTETLALVSVVQKVSSLLPMDLPFVENLHSFLWFMKLLPLVFLILYAGTLYTTLSKGDRSARELPLSGMLAVITGLLQLFAGFLALVQLGMMAGSSVYGYLLSAVLILSGGVYFLLPHLQISWQRAYPPTQGWPHTPPTSYRPPGPMPPAGVPDATRQQAPEMDDATRVIPESPSPAPSASLVSPQGHQWPLVWPETTIGRHPQNTLVLHDSSVSKFHARIFFKDGQFWLEDLNSTNGTTINGRKLRGGTVPLAHGDEIIFGVAPPMRFFLKSGAQPDTQA